MEQVQFKYPELKIHSVKCNVSHLLFCSADKVWPFSVPGGSDHCGKQHFEVLSAGPPDEPSGVLRTDGRCRWRRGEGSGTRGPGSDVPPCRGHSQGCVASGHQRGRHSAGYTEGSVCGPTAQAQVCQGSMRTPLDQSEVPLHQSFGPFKNCKTEKTSITIVT